MKYPDAFTIFTIDVFTLNKSFFSPKSLHRCGVCGESGL